MATIVHQRGQGVDSDWHVPMWGLYLALAAIIVLCGVFALALYG